MRGDRAVWPRLPARLWRRSVALGKEVAAAAGGLLAALSVVLVAAIFVESLTDRTINVQPLSVPRSLAEDGLSPEVVALGLRDRMTTLAGKVRRERGFSEGTEIIDPEELPDVAVPSVGLSAQALAADVRAFFKIQNRLVISGEVVSRDGAYELTLRLNGRSFFRSPRGLPRDRMEALIEQGARAASVATEPYVGAALAFDDRDDASAIALCDGIISSGGTAPRVRFARLLRAQALNRTGRQDEAVAAYEALIALDRRDVAAHVDLGDIRAAQGRRDAAVAEYREAIAIDGSLAFPHAHLAEAHLAMGRPEDAVAEARAGVSLRRKVPYQHLVLGDALHAAGRDAEAVVEYRAAAALGPARAGVRVALGEALRRSGLPDEAIAQFRAAVALDPGWAEACRRLATALGEPNESGGSGGRGRDRELPPECETVEAAPATGPPGAARPVAGAPNSAEQAR